jgi:hypothetical protein
VVNEEGGVAMQGRREQRRERDGRRLLAGSFRSQPIDSITFSVKSSKDDM